MSKTKAARRLINHRDVAKRFGVTARTWRRWYTVGQVPEPHQFIGTMLLYDKAVIEHRLATGEWPAGVRFRGQEGRGPEEEGADGGAEDAPPAG